MIFIYIQSSTFKNDSLIYFFNLFIMNKYLFLTIISILIIVIIYFWTLLLWLNKSSSDLSDVKNQTLNQSDNVKSEKIEIIEFHNTQRCATCLKAEELLKKTLDTKFNEEQKAWIVSFKDINIDLPENQEITNKFQATWLSVGVNSIINWIDNLEYDMWWWRLIWNEKQYISYFEDKINNLLK